MPAALDAHSGTVRVPLVVGVGAQAVPGSRSRRDPASLLVALGRSIRRGLRAEGAAPPPVGRCDAVDRPDAPLPRDGPHRRRSGGNDARRNPEPAGRPLGLVGRPRAARRALRPDRGRAGGPGDRTGDRAGCEPSSTGRWTSSSSRTCRSARPCPAASTRRRSWRSPIARASPVRIERRSTCSRTTTTAPSRTSGRTSGRSSNPIRSPHEVHWVSSSPAALADGFERYVRHQEEPYADVSSYAEYCLAAEAQRSGVKVLLSGLGGDEVFVGYPSFFGPLLLDLMRRGEFGAARTMIGVAPEVLGRPGAYAFPVVAAAYHALPARRAQRLVGAPQRARGRARPVGGASHRSRTPGGTGTGTTDAARRTRRCAARSSPGASRVSCCTAIAWAWPTASRDGCRSWTTA